MTKKNPQNIDIQVDGTMLANVVVSIDGTWQKRGHLSKHGVVFLISVVTGEVLDFCVKTIYCHECTLHKKDDINSEKHKQWYREIIHLIARLIMKDRLVLWSDKLVLTCFLGQLPHET